MNRPPQNQLEKDLVFGLKKQPRHDQVIWLLKSPAFFAYCQGWEDQKIEQKIRMIENRLSADEKQRGAA